MTGAPVPPLRDKFGNPLEADGHGPWCAIREVGFTNRAKCTCGAPKIEREMVMVTCDDCGHPHACIRAAAPPVAPPRWSDKQLREALEAAAPTVWEDGEWVYDVREANLDAMRAMLERP
jgi:hypothetical protein